MVCEDSFEVNDFPFLLIVRSDTPWLGLCVGACMLSDPMVHEIWSYLTWDQRSVPRHKGTRAIFFYS